MLADKIARRGKSDQHSIKRFDKDWEGNLRKLQEELKNKTYSTSPYFHFTLYDPKKREISSLPYRDRIAHHAIMIQLERMFVCNFTADTYSCIKGRGIHKAQRKLEKILRNDIDVTRYCLKLDVTQFYPSIDHDILKAKIRRKIKDNDLLELLDEIIDSAPGVPIGNYLSQYFANFYLSGLDHWLKETIGVKYYFRYADDLVLLAGSKKELHELLWKIDVYLTATLKLNLKGNYQLFQVAAQSNKPANRRKYPATEMAGRGIDVLGYVFYRFHTELRKTIKQSWARAVSRGAKEQSIRAYEGWGKHCDTINLQRKLKHASRNIIQRPRDQVPRADRGQNRNRESPQQKNKSNRVSDQGQPVRQKERGCQMSLFTDTL